MCRDKSFIRVSFSSKLYGGNVYEEAVDSIFLKYTDDFRVMRIGGRWSGAAKVLGLPSLIFRVLKSYLSGRRLVVNFLSLPFFPFLKESIIILHHVDTAGCTWRVALHQQIASWFLRRVVSRTNLVVVVARYWEEYVRSAGFPRVRTIYNPFDAQRYIEVSESEVEDFLAKYSLNRSGIVYIGNPQPGKGYSQVLDALEGRGYQLISTGLGEPDEKRARHLQLSHREFVILLQLSECVVTFSQFKEGWCRVAHEAMLCSTPVVGSGSGGMRELLSEGGQLIASSKDELPALVEKAISERKARGFKGRSCALQFDYDRFERAWKDIIRDL